MNKKTAREMLSVEEEEESEGRKRRRKREGERGERRGMNWEGEGRVGKRKDNSLGPLMGSSGGMWLGLQAVGCSPLQKK